MAESWSSLDALVLKAIAVQEAQALTELSKYLLRDAINEGSLKAKMIGRSWRIKRSDLDEFVATLF